MKSQKTQKTPVQKTRAAAEAFAKVVGKRLGLRARAFVESIGERGFRVMIAVETSTDFSVGDFTVEYSTLDGAYRVSSYGGIFGYGTIEPQYMFRPEVKAFNKALGY